MLSEAKRLIEAVIRKRTSIRKIATRKTDEDTFISQKALPYAAIYSADGRFDERTVRYVKVRTDSGGLQGLQVRGTRKVPFEIRIAAATEAEADKWLGEVLRYLPLKWSIGDFAGNINILTEHADDYSSNAAGRAMSSAFVMMTMEIGTDPETVPQIGGATVTPEGSA
jgi:hypothetical protein